MLTTATVYEYLFQEETAAPGVTAEWTGPTSSWGYYDPANGTVMIDITGLPAHTMALVTISTEPDTMGPYGDPWDTEQVDWTFADQSRTTYYEAGGFLYQTGTLGWFAHEDDTITITGVGTDFEGVGDTCDVIQVAVTLYTPTVTLAGGASNEGAEDAVLFNISRDLPGGWNSTTDDPVPDTTVNLTRGGTAVSGADYNGVPSSTAAITNSSSTLAVIGNVVLDNLCEIGETITLTATSGTGYILGSPAAATHTITDLGEMFLDAKFTDIEPEDFDDGFGGIVGDYQTVVFDVDIYAETGSPRTTIPAYVVAEQTYTLTLEGDASLISVSDSLSRIWTVSGSTASLTVGGPVTGESFTVGIEFRLDGSGLVSATLEGTASRGQAELLSDSSSRGRAIRAHPTPGATVTPTRIYHLVDQEGPLSNGHSAVLIPNGAGVTYYSYAMDGGVTTQTYANITDALTMAKAANYTHYQYWDGITPAEATAARAAAAAFNGTEYDTTTRNCWDMVAAALEAANTNANTAATTPNLGYRDNEAAYGGNADYSGGIP